MPQRPFTVFRYLNVGKAYGVISDYYHIHVILLYQPCEKPVYKVSEKGGTKETTS